MNKRFRWNQLNLTVSNSMLILMLSFTRPLVAQKPEIHKFTVADPTGYSISSVNFTRQDVTGNVQCAVLCSTTRACFAYMYNSTDKSCSVGGDVVATGAALDASTRLYARGHNEETISCASNDFSYTECVPSSPAVSVTLSRQLSSSACTSGTSFGLSGAGAVWVDQGCRGEFKVCF